MANGLTARYRVRVILPRCLLSWPLVRSSADPCGTAHPSVVMPEAERYNEGMRNQVVKRVSRVFYKHSSSCSACHLDVLEIQYIGRTNQGLDLSINCNLCFNPLFHHTAATVAATSHKVHHVMPNDKKISYRSCYLVQEICHSCESTVRTFTHPCPKHVATKEESVDVSFTRAADKPVADHGCNEQIRVDSLSPGDRRQYSRDRPYNNLSSSMDLDLEDRGRTGTALRLRWRKTRHSISRWRARLSPDRARSSSAEPSMRAAKARKPG